MNRQIQDDALYNDRFEEEKKTEWKRYYGVMLMISYLLFFIFWFFAHSNIQEKQQRTITKQECIQLFESLSVR